MSFAPQTSRNTLRRRRSAEEIVMGMGVQRTPHAHQ
jgi:hypothetical protein